MSDDQQIKITFNPQPKPVKKERVAKVKVRTRRCKWCSERFDLKPWHAVGYKVCEKENCRTLAIAEACEKAKKQHERERKNKSKAMVSDAKCKLNKMKQLPELKKELQPLINHIARLIDWGLPCMMHGDYFQGNPHGCHYHSTRSQDSIRFNLHNIHQGCYSCNKGKGGNINGYDEQLISVYGKQYWEYVKFGIVRTYQYCGLRKTDIEALKVAARKIIKELLADSKTYTTVERLALREKYNKRLGIYLKELEI